MQGSRSLFPSISILSTAALSSIRGLIQRSYLHSMKREMPTPAAKKCQCMWCCMDHVHGCSLLSAGRPTNVVPRGNIRIPQPPYPGFCILAPAGTLDLRASRGCNSSEIVRLIVHGLLAKHSGTPSTPTCIAPSLLLSRHCWMRFAACHNATCSAVVRPQWRSAWGSHQPSLSARVHHAERPDQRCHLALSWTQGA